MKNNKEEKKRILEEEIRKKFWNPYSNNTSTLSNICRQLAFAEGGICWFFFTAGKKLQILTLDIKVILLFLVLFFIFDACQYFCLAFYNKIIAFFYEEKVNDRSIKRQADITRPIWINYPGNFCFGMKLFCIGMASFFLIGKFFFQYFQS